MIKATPKPIKEIIDAIEEYERILVLGCGGCVSVCLAGGLKEAQTMARDMGRLIKNKGRSVHIDSYTVERQCNLRFIEELDERVTNYDCLVSMACGAGVQLVAEHFSKTPVFPGVNTVSIGIDRDIGVYEEKCRACGECVLGYTAGVCPVTRCAKGLFNGPCGGTNNGKCEVSQDIPCAWVDIYNRLNEQNRLHHILKIRQPMEWQNQIQRTTVQPAYAGRYYGDDK